MPYKSEAQKKLVLAAAHNKEFADKIGFKQEAAKKFAKDAGGKTKKYKKLKDKLGMK